MDHRAECRNLSPRPHRRLDLASRLAAPEPLQDSATPAAEKPSKVAIGVKSVKALGAESGFARVERLARRFCACCAGASEVCGCCCGLTVAPVPRPVAMGRLLPCVPRHDGFAAPPARTTLPWVAMSGIPSRTPPPFERLPAAPRARCVARIEAGEACLLLRLGRLRLLRRSLESRSRDRPRLRAEDQDLGPGHLAAPSRHCGSAAAAPVAPWASAASCCGRRGRGSGEGACQEPPRRACGVAVRVDSAGPQSLFAWGPLSAALARFEVRWPSLSAASARSLASVPSSIAPASGSCGRH